MHISILTIAIATALCIGFACQVEAQGPVWTDAKTLTIEGKGWIDTPAFYDRIPSKYVGKISESVTWLATNSTGMVVRFITNSPTISAKWALTSPSLEMPHMPATGVSGLDLYVKHKGKWGFLANGRPAGVENTQTMAGGMPKVDTEYALYLPLYNGVKSVEIGIDAGATIKPAGPRTGGTKSVVFYGTSITQGGCASRPAMAYSTIIGRMLDMPTINLGFSGSGKAEHEASNMLAELDPAVYVIDCLPNMQADQVDERIRYMLSVLKAKRPNTPVILVENIIYQDQFVRTDKPQNTNVMNVTLAKIYKDEAKNWNGKLYYIKCDKLTGTDGEATVDGCHMTDLGFLRMSEVMVPVIKRALGK
jgi:hypothetical protein